jgi:hypothetical protein
MKRNEIRRSLQKIKKGLDTTPKDVNSTEVSIQNKGKALFCTCEDALGHPKMLYSSKKEAEEALGYSQALNLRIYPCPSEKGWHLTKG